MTVRAHGDQAFRLQQDLAGEVHGGHAALPEKMHPRRIQTEELVRREKRPRRRVIRMARHDEPVQRAAVAPASRQDFFREHLEQRFPLERGHRKGSLGPVISEPRALAARHGERRHLAGPQRVLTCRPRPRPGRGIAATLRPAYIRRRFEVRQRDRGGCTVAEQRAGEARNLVQIDFRGLVQERLAFLPAHPGPKREDLPLAGLLKSIDQRTR